MAVEIRMTQSAICRLGSQSNIQNASNVPLAELDVPELIAPQNGRQVEVRRCGIGREIEGRRCGAGRCVGGRRTRPPVGASEAFGVVGAAPLHATVNAHKPMTRCRM